MGDDAHGVEQLAAEELETDDAALGIVRKILLQHEEIVGQPDAGIAREDRFDVGQRIDDLNTRAAAALVRLQERRPADLSRVGGERPRVVERDRAWAIDAQGTQERGLRALAQLERENIGAVEDAGAEQLERAHVRQRQRHGARVAAQISARARLVEVERCAQGLDVAEGRLGQVERLERHAAPRERRKERLLPLGMLVKDDEIWCGRHHEAPIRRSVSAGCQRIVSRRGAARREEWNSEGTRRHYTEAPHGPGK